jgi:two-component system chemotaxis response regulator CheB
MSPPGTLRDLVVIGASAGGVEALRSLVSGLPATLPAAVLVVLHLPPGGISALAGILGAACPLPTAVARHGAEIEPGHVYVAPPDHHLLVDGRHVVLSTEPPENGHRPAVDALFRSAAGSRGPAVAGIVLSGALDDGTAGLVAIKAHGGLTIVQRPDEAAYRGMPDSALANVLVDHVLPAATIGRQLERILAGPLGSVCPKCGKAVLTTDRELGCTGPDQLKLADQEVRTALWIAVRALDEKTALARRMAASADSRGNW